MKCWNCGYSGTSRYDRLIGRLPYDPTKPCLCGAEFRPSALIGLFADKVEMTAPEYERQVVQLVHLDKNWTNLATVQFPRAQQAWGTVTRVRLFIGDVEVSVTAPIDVTLTVNPGVQVTVPPGGIRLEAF